MTLFYRASMLKPTISSLDKTEIWSFKWIGYNPLEITPKAKLQQHWEGAGNTRTSSAHEALILLSASQHQHHPTQWQRGWYCGSQADVEDAGDAEDALQVRWTTTPQGTHSLLWASAQCWPHWKKNRKKPQTIPMFVFSLVSLVESLRGKAPSTCACKSSYRLLVIQ